MNRQLKQDIDLLFDGSADETRAAAKRLGLEAGGAAQQADFSHIEKQIWQKYGEGSRQKGESAFVAKLLAGPWRAPAIAAAATALIAAGAVWFLGLAEQPLNRVAFDHAHPALTNYTFQQKLQLGLRHGEGLELQSQGQNFRLKSRAIWGRFEFEKKSGNSLVIETPRGTFSVTGTRFILKANAQQALLQVEEGSVRVEEGGRVMAVTANQQYFDDGRGGAVSEIRPDERAIFAAFVNATLDNAQLLKGAANRQPNPLRVVTVAVELFDGNHVSGELLSESAEALVIKPKNFQAITVKKTEIKSSTRK